MGSTSATRVARIRQQRPRRRWLRIMRVNASVKGAPKKSRTARANGQEVVLRLDASIAKRRKHLSTRHQYDLVSVNFLAAGFGFPTRDSSAGATPSNGL